MTLVFMQAALAQSGVDADDVDHVYFVTSCRRRKTRLPARHIGLKAGLPQRVPAVGVNRLCGSGFESIPPVRVKLCGDAQVVFAGGTESMSQAPHIVRGARTGYPLGRAPEMEDAYGHA